MTLSLISSYSCPVFALALLLSSFRISLYSFLMRVKKLPSGKSSVRGKVKIFTNGSLHKITSPKDYDMVIIDEAHKFRNDTAQAYDELQRICKTKNNEDEVKKVMLTNFFIQLPSFCSCFATF
jgi:hypothetical protein